MHAKDRAIMRVLRTNSRAKLLDISKETGIPISTIHDRIRKLSKQYRFVSLLNFVAAHLPIHEYLIVKSRDREKTYVKIMNSQYVNNVWSVSNGADFIVECVFPHFQAEHKFVQSLEEASVEVHPVIEVIARESLSLDSRQQV